MCVITMGNGTLIVNDNNYAGDDEDDNNDDTGALSSDSCGACKCKKTADQCFSYTRPWMAV